MCVIITWGDSSMNNTEIKKELYEKLNAIRAEYDAELKAIDKELDAIGRQNTYIVIKRINGNNYYYEQWRDGKSIKSRNLGKVAPGTASEYESKIKKRTELLKKYAELLRMHDKIKKECDLLASELQAEKRTVNLEEYTFEVYHKNDISARVLVRKDKVHVTRFIIHPVRQLFYSDNITRNQLNEIFRLRCFDENRPDAMDKLRYLGLTEYNPKEIVKKTHGVSYNDYLWFRFEGENLRAEDVLVRDEYVQCRNR